VRGTSLDRREQSLADGRRQQADGAFHSALVLIDYQEELLGAIRSETT